MSKSCSKDKNKHRVNIGAISNKDIVRNKQQATVCIGATNVKLWSNLKLACNFNCDVEFTNFLLKLAQKHIRKQNAENKDKCKNSDTKPEEYLRRSVRQSEQILQQNETKKKYVKSHHRKSENNKINNKLKDCDSKKEKIKIKRKSSIEKIADLISENLVDVNSEKDCSKVNIEYPLPMVVVEKMNYNISSTSNSSKTNTLFTIDNIALQTKCEETSLIKEELANNVITECTKTDLIQSNIENIVLSPIEAQDEKNNVVKHHKKHKSNDTEEYNYTNNTELPLIKNDTKNSKHKIQEKIERHKRKIKNHDIRKAPELDIKTVVKSESAPNSPQLLPVMIQEIPANDGSGEIHRVAIKIKLCNNCNTRHLQDACPLRNPVCIIEDMLTFDEWIKTSCQKEQLNMSDTSTENNDKTVDIDLQMSMDSNDKSYDNTTIHLKKEFQPFSIRSLPSVLYLEEMDSTHGLSVFTKCEIKEFTQFGPLIGKIVKEVDISEDFGMKNLWEIFTEKTNLYVNTEDASESNWVRYIRPAPTRELRNVSAVSHLDQLYMVSTRNIVCGEELLYWQDDALGTNKRKMEKTNCGGCNLSFAHPLYYRTHCSIFHDIRYSLTIRKYHCKVCGLAILGKDNIMKHAVEQHNGQGAYQCQFCKKFFLRLNYLEMHRTYGCAANPHRSRPLCDFCGRKFCQPQKLKVHIKRMHSDMTEVLREFQCKNCLKLLGSRAALQRHVKEVHQKQVEGACTCIRCGKLFQNKSNLKIHMLTHSGVKPFKCKEDNCNAAFTTKQCLQFHYKKVHGFSEDIMPKIERSVEYTFAAYAGVKDNEPDILLKGNKKKRTPKNNNNNLMCLDESTDADDDISLDEKNIDEPPALHSPTPIISEHSSGSNQTPPMLEPFSSNTNRSGKVLSKGSKKWLGEDLTPTLNLPIAQVQKDLYQFEKETTQKTEDTSNIILEVDETQTFERTKLNLNLNLYNRHESSNASLLVEAALDSVSDIQISSSEPNIDVSGSQSCTDSLVNNLYSLSHQDNLADVTYSHNEDLNESRDINLISPSVNDHISVTDHDLNDDLPNRGITLDYSSLHHGEFSPSSSPNMQTRSQLMHDYNNIHGNSPAHTPRSRLDYNLGHESEIVSPGNSPSRYDFHQNPPVENLSSDESNNDIVAQNLSLNNTTTKGKMRLDLVGYKSHYGDLDISDLSLRKYEGFRKYDLESDRNKIYELAMDERTKSYNDAVLNSNNVRNKFDVTNAAECNNTKSYSETLENEIRNKSYDNIEHTDIKMKQFDIDAEFRSKYHDDDSIRPNKYDQISSKYDDDLHSKQLEMDVELRSKNFDSLESDRSKSLYDNNLDAEIRNKTYDVTDSLDIRNKSYDSIVDTDFSRTDRNFEPIVLNSTELQGLDMSARSYHNFHPSGSVQGINRYHHIYSELDRPSVDLRLSYSPPPPPYTHADVLRVVSLDLTPPGRHSVDLSLRSHSLHPHQLPNSRLLTDHPLQTNRLISTEHNLSTNRILSEHNRLTLDQSRLLSTEHNLSVTSNRLLSSDRLISDSGNRLISDHTTNRLLSNDQISTNRLLSSEQSRVISDETRLLSEQSRLLDQRGLLGETRILQPTPANTPSLELVARGGLSPGYPGYSVSPSSYHASSLAARTHGSSPGHTTAASYHHYSTYY